MEWTLVVALVWSTRMKRWKETTQQLGHLLLLLLVFPALIAAANGLGEEFDIFDGKLCKY
jgi:hypothetical protein